MPGTSGILTPFGKIKGLYFDDSKEPDDFEYNLKKDLEKITKDDGYEHIGIVSKNKDEYYDALDRIMAFNKDLITIYSKAKEERDVIQEEFRDLDVEPTPTPRKKGDKEENDPKEESA